MSAGRHLGASVAGVSTAARADTAGDSVRPAKAREKRCTKCGEVYPISDFPKGGRNKGGGRVRRSSWCRYCVRSATYARRHGDDAPRCATCRNILLEAGRCRKCEGIQRCSICQAYKALSEFARNPRRPNGYSHECKACRGEVSRAYEQAAKARRAERIQQDIEDERLEFWQLDWASRWGLLLLPLPPKKTAVPGLCRACYQPRCRCRLHKGCCVRCGRKVTGGDSGVILHVCPVCCLCLYACNTRVCERRLRIVLKMHEAVCHGPAPRGGEAGRCARKRRGSWDGTPCRRCEASRVLAPQDDTGGAG